MGGSKVEQTDSSSIRPVSSLRSHFEGIASSNTQPGETIAAGPSARPKQVQNERPQLVSRPSSRTSLDVPSRKQPERPVEPARADSSQKLLPPPRPPTRRSLSPHGLTASRPVSAGSSSPIDTHDVDLSRSYGSTADETTGHALSRSQPNNHVLSQPSGHLLQPQAASYPVAATASAAGANGNDIRAPRSSGEVRRDNGVTGRDSSAERRAAPAKPVLIPPPVNRADKPKQLNVPGTLQPRADERATPPVARTPTPTPNKLTVTTISSSIGQNARNGGVFFPSSNGAAQTAKAEMSPLTAQLSPFDPPPVHHSVAQKLRDMRDGGSSPVPGGPGDKQRGSISMSPWPMDPFHTNAAVPSRAVAIVSDHTRRHSVARTASSSPPARPSHGPTSNPVKIPNTVAAFPPPPRRTNTSGSLDDEGVAMQAPSRMSMIERRPSSDLIPSRHHSVSVQSAGTADSTESGYNGSRRPPTEYPDSSRANRRRPYFRQGLHEISTKNDTKLVALCGEYVCSTGPVTRIWNIQNGEPVMTLLHGEHVRVTSLAFRSSRNPKEMGRWLWLGTNHGEIQEVDVLSAEVAFIKTSAHPRREVIKIHPHGDEMWTLDDEGKLHLWPPDATGSPSLKASHYGFRVPKGHSFSMVVGDELWIATGKDIRVFRPSSDAGAHFDVLARPLNQTGVGEVTSGAVIGPRSEEVFFGHTDGKVTVYSSEDYACLRIVNVSVYKINSLAGVGEDLWAGYNTGMLYVYDTRTKPWKVKKDWHAHENPVTEILVDRSHFPNLDPFRVASLGMDSFVRLWDGMLQEDWLESEMHRRHVDYCTFRDVTALVTTWNAGASKTHSLDQSGEGDTLFNDLLGNADAPDILVFGFQELVDLEDTKLTAKSLFRSTKRKETPNHEEISRQYGAWREYLTRRIRQHLPSEPYYLLQTATMVGLFTCVFVKASQSQYIKGVHSSVVKCGMAGLYGNKGALIVRFALDDSSICFVNCHLAAGQGHTTHRNNDIATILESPALTPELDPSRRIDLYVGGGDGTMILDHEICVLNGDLNYRIETIGRDSVISAVRTGNLSKLLDRDQLLLARRTNPGFRLRAFVEAPITFAPTYKYDVGTDTYDTSEKKRAPAWCDRLLYRGFDRIEQLDYRRHEVRVSDHRPVSGRFRIQVKNISPKQRLVAWERCEQALAAYKERLAAEA